MACLQLLAQTADAGRDTVVMAESFPAVYLLDGSQSKANNPIINYYWVLEDDTLANSETFMIPLEIGKNRFKLIIEDDQGNTDSDVIDLFAGHSTNNGMNRLPLRESTQIKFVSGMNIAWNNFANDLNEFTQEDRVYFENLMDVISSEGGNSLRWWLHTNGANTPNINENGFVEGIDFETIQGMKQILDMAYDRGIVISMCLWSFDMLQNQNQDRGAMKMLLEDSTNIQSYIDNALIPVLDLIGDHPAVMTWEIFNEPEGMTNEFGWTPTRIQMSDVQRFVNMCAGAIHRNTPSALVSNGAWNIQASSDVDDFKNYYSKENLVDKGGDPDGYLDFYQVHYYPAHSGNDKSPLHRPASYWELDAPIVIGEFPADTVSGRANPGFSVARAYEVALAYGYAGIMSWSWSDTNFNRDFRTTARGLNKVKSLLGEEMVIPNDLDIERIPQVVQNITPFRSVIEEITGDEVFLDLKNFFLDEEDGNALSYSIVSVSDTEITSPTIENDSEVKLQFPNPAPGLTIIEYKGSDSQGWYATAESAVMIGTLEGNAENHAYFKPVYSSTEAFEKFNLYLNDGNLNTKWESESQDSDTIVIDLQTSLNQNFIAIHWDGNSVTDYLFQTSDDSISWETVFDESYALGNEIVFTAETSIQSRYIRLVMVNNNQNRTFAISEITSEFVSDNQSPTIVVEIDDWVQQLTTVNNVNNYIRFENIFTDLEHPEYLVYEFENSNKELVQAKLSIGRVGLSLIFEDGQVGSSTITVTATDPFGASVSTSFIVAVEDDILGVPVETNEVIIYPNPVANVLKLDFSSTESIPYQFEIFNTRGQSIRLYSNTMKLRDINVADLEVGAYIVEFQSQSGKSFKRFIKK